MRRPSTPPLIELGDDVAIVLCNSRRDGLSARPGAIDGDAMWLPAFPRCRRRRRPRLVTAVRSRRGLFPPRTLGHRQAQGHRGRRGHALDRRRAAHFGDVDAASCRRRPLAGVTFTFSR